MANGKGIFPPLATAAAWAKANHFRQLYASLLTLAAEDHLVLGQTQQAMALLDEARAAIGNRTMAAGRLARTENVPGGHRALPGPQDRPTATPLLAKAMHFMRTRLAVAVPHATGRRVLYQRRQRRRQRRAGGHRSLPDRAPRSAAGRLADRPDGVAGGVCVPHGLIFEHWFEAAVARKDHELALEVADRARRHRFLSSCPLGGRLESLRWVLEGPRKCCPSRPCSSGRTC